MAAPLADFPFEEVMLSLLVLLPLLLFPLPLLPFALTWLLLFITPFLAVVAEWLLVVAKLSSASLLSTRRFLVGGVAVVKDSALLDI